MTKEQILQKVSPLDIYLHYLHINKFPTSNISSPFTEDKRPSFKLYKNGTFKCFSSGNQGDVWQFVANLYNLDCKANFAAILQKVADDLRILTERPTLCVNNIKHAQVPHVPNVPQSQLKVNPPLRPVGEAAFKIETFELTNIHYNYYQQYTVSAATLQRFNVKTLRKFQFWQESKKVVKQFPIYDGVIAFAYEVNGRYEIYIPDQEFHSPSGESRRVAKFFCNQLTSDDIFGFEQAQAAAQASPSGRLEGLIITAGKKDCLILNEHGYYAVCFRSENHYPTDAQIERLCSLLTLPLQMDRGSGGEAGGLYICYDNDFTNPKNPGQAAQQKIIERYPFIIPIYLPESTNDIGELYYKGGNIDQSFITAQENRAAQAIQAEINKEAKQTIFHIAEKYLSAHYRIRYNSIKLELQCQLIGNSFSLPRVESWGGAAWKKINENSLFIEIQKSGINISIDKLVAILKSDYTPEYNPVTTYFKNLHPWDNSQPDYIAKLASFIKAKEQSQFEYHFKKWLVRCVKCATISDYFNKQAFILVSPKQNDGKSTFCRFLCPPALKDYIAEDITNDKDARILLCRNFLINLDELAVLSKQEINSLKAFFSKTQINERLPYDRTNSIIPRIANFIGSTNQDEFLSDETGSVRWLCFTIHGIDFNYSKEIDINRVWAQALCLANDGSFQSEFSREDIEENERRNKDFQIVSVERELIRKAFRKPVGDEQGIFLSATEIMQHIVSTEIIPHKTLSQVAIGRGLKQEGFERLKMNGYYGYIAIPNKSITISHQPNNR